MVKRVKESDSAVESTASPCDALDLGHSRLLLNLRYSSKETFQILLWLQFWRCANGIMLYQRCPF